MAKLKMLKCLSSVLILRRRQSRRLEGWRQASPRPSFEMRPAGAPQDEVRCFWFQLLLMGFFLITVSVNAFAAERQLDIGRVAIPAEIAGWDIDVRPDGQGLPPG